MIKWTQNQDRAITARGADLLVSASAGSGKTAVMIERIASMIVCREACADSILVLTFTRESAADMRAKLRVRLQKELELAKGKADRDYLVQQINALQIADIGTFHAFCNKLITTHFSVAGLDPAFQILDSVESAALRSEVLDEIIAKNYAECTEAIDVFCANRTTEHLKNIIVDIKEPFLNSRSNPEEWLRTTAFAGYNINLSENPAMRQILEYYRLAGKYFTGKFKACEIEAGAENMERLMQIIGRHGACAGRLASAGSYSDIHSFAVTAELDPLNRGIGKKERECGAWSEFKAAHDRFKKLIENVCEQYSQTEEQMQRNQRGDLMIVKQVIDLVKEFGAAYLARKISANKFDYSDLESYAVKVLSDPVIAASVREKYKFIFVDEYQDTNPMQEKILSLAGAESRIFMVGDVKQSIYGFRGCEPTIFAGKVTDFETNLSGKVVLLNENFRSNPAILKFVNSVFTKVMRGAVAGIDYAATGKFAPGEPYPVLDDMSGAVEVIIVDTHKEKGGSREPVDVYNVAEDNAETDEIKSAQAEAALIAEKIRQFEKSQIWNAKEKKFQKVRLSDIAVLARRKEDFKILLEVLRASGIEAAVQADRNAAELLEIALLNNMLLAVSNFYNDVAVVLLMQSFVFGFTPDDLAAISTFNSNDAVKGLAFYKKISDYTECNDNELSGRLALFVEFLNRYHELGKREDVVSVLTRFITEFRITDSLLTISEGAAMVHNIHAFLNKVRGQSYGSTVAGYVFALESGTLELKIGASRAGTDCVQLMTMHGAKGLEWPVVILFGTGARFNTADSRKFMVVDKQCGLCIYSTDTDEYVRHNSVARLGAVISAERVLVSEELRLLYVALTRAKNHLLVVGSASADKLVTEFEDYDITCAANYLQFLAPTVMRPVAECDFVRSVIPLDGIKVQSYSTKGRVLSGHCNEKLLAKLQKVFSQKYEFQSDTAEILKNSVSSLTRREEEVIDFKPFQAASCDRGAEYGTLFHRQLCRTNFDEVEDSASEDVKRCVETIKPLIKDMKVFKELPFLQQIEKGGTQILVQGVIDLLAVDGGRAVLVDYKTTNASVNKLLEIYTSQLQMYADAVRPALGGAEPEVYIYSTVHKRLIRV